MGRLAICLLGIILLIAGCGRLPRPFQPADKAGNGLLYLNDGIGITVMPLTHHASGAPKRTAETLAAALRERNMPASTQGGTAGSRRLSGRAMVQELTGGKEEVLLYWELSDPGGRRLAATTQRSELPPGAWRSGDPDVIGRMMEQAAGKIAELVQRPAVEEVAPPRQAHLVVLPMADLPGDGRLSLSRALEAALRAARLPLAAEPGEGDLLIACQVTLGAPDDAWQEVRVRWTVTRAGEELGQINQQNRLPAGSLDGPWGATAGGIAAGAAQGILELIGQLDRAI